MTESARNGYVLVGVDYGPESVAAAKWAVDDAQARGRDVVLAHGIPLLYGDAPTTADMIDQIVADAEALVADLMSQVVIPPGLTVQAVIEPSPPVALLRRLAESAVLVVLGRHHQTLFQRMTEGSITSPLSAHAPCPVMVVPAEYAWAAGYRKPVVVALDAATAAGSALEFAFDEAAQRQVDLTVLHARPLGESAVAVDEDLVTLAEILGRLEGRPARRQRPYSHPARRARRSDHRCINGGLCDGGGPPPSATVGELDPISGPRRAPSRPLSTGDRPRAVTTTKSDGGSGWLSLRA